MTTALLLGAGASSEAGVPVTGEMTERIAELVEEDPDARRLRLDHALHFIIGQMVGHDTAHGARAFDSLDVERVLSAVRLLAERSDLEVSPFIATWHPAVDSFDSVAASTSSPNFDGNFRKELARGSPGSLEKLLRGIVRSEVAMGSGGTYRRLLAQMTIALRQLVAITDPAATAYLAPIARLTREQGSLTIATLNYDVAIETMCAAEGLNCSTGITKWAETGHWIWPRRGVRLLKLHGSIDWAVRDEKRAEPGLLPSHRITASSKVDPRSTPAVVFGQREKLRATGPFLELLAQFTRHLAKSSHLIVVGYSFRDEHVNEQVRRWLNGAESRHLTVIDPAFPERPNWRLQDFRWQLLTSLNPSTVSTAAGAFPLRLTVLRTPASEGLLQTVEEALAE